MAENKLGIGRIAFPMNTDNQLLIALEELVRKADDNVNYLLKPSIKTVTSSYSAVDLDRTIVCDGTLTVTLPEAKTVSGKIVSVKNIGSGEVTIDGYGSEEIDGQTTLGLVSVYEYATLHCDGTAWHRI